jgi:hypothetical protein
MLLPSKPTSEHNIRDLVFSTQWGTIGETLLPACVNISGSRRVPKSPCYPFPYQHATDQHAKGPVCSILAARWTCGLEFNTPSGTSGETLLPACVNTFGSRRVPKSPCSPFLISMQGTNMRRATVVHLPSCSKDGLDIQP